VISLDRRTLPLAILALGALATALLIATRPRVAAIPPEPRVPLVRVQPLVPETLRLRVHTHGEVRPRTESDLVPEVAGTVQWVSPNLVSGGFFTADEPLLRIDPLDYDLALETARATRARAASDLERAQRELARQRTLAEQDIASVSRLDDTETAARSAAAALRQAEAALRQAERNRERAEIRAPYAGRVRDEAIDVGQFVNRGAPVARIYAVDFAEVRLPIPDEALAHLDLSLAPGAAAPGPEVRLSAEFAGRAQSWTGRVVRTEGELDPKTRMVHVVARVDEPYRVAEPGAAPLSVGLFVDAEIAGREVSGVFEIPREALREGGRIFAVDADERLRIVPVEVVQAGRERVVIRADVTTGARLVLSALSAPVEGMALRAAGAPEPAVAASPEEAP
jgi:RND family efflux transporter MFP subunit